MGQVINRPWTGLTKTVEADDPLELVGVRYPTASPGDDDDAMGHAFVEEFALMGWDADRIRTLFLSPMYAGPHGIVHRHGIAFVDEIIEDVFGPGAC